MFTEAAITPVVFIFCLAGMVFFAYAMYGQRYGSENSLLAFNLEDPVCFNPEFHHQFLMQQIARLPHHSSGNSPDATVQLAKLQLSDRVLNVAIPGNAIRFQGNNRDDEFVVASAHDVMLERVGQAPYVYGADVSVSGQSDVSARILVARNNLQVSAKTLQADGLLANGHVEISCQETCLSRVSGFSYRFSLLPLPSIAQQAFNYKRYNCDAARRVAQRKMDAIADYAIVTENILCGGDLTVGAGAIVHGAVKVYGSMKLAGPVVFLGPVVVNGDLEAPGGCVFMSDTVIKGSLTVSGFLVAGQPQRHSVCLVARRLNLTGAVAGSGTIVASEQEGLRYAA